MNKKWIDEKIKILDVKLCAFKPNNSDFFFEPTKHIYDKLDSGFDLDLQYVAREIAYHIGIDFIPNCKYEWGLKMELEVAGQISSSTSSHSIEIPFYYAGRKYAVGYIIAHEMTHAFLFSKGISLNDSKENEVFTDLTAIFIGLGKFLMNGVIVTNEKCDNEGLILGYLSPELITYCYNSVCEHRDIHNLVALKNLTPEAMKSVRNIN